MNEYLFRVTIEFGYTHRGEQSPVYAVAESKKAACEYVQRHLRQSCKVKSVVLLGEQLGMKMYHGKPKKNTEEYKRILA
jgi:hypothetical protein